MIHKHLNKSFLYYIEFIEQIGEEGNTFLQLSSKDAVLFVYKKTLFEINTDYKKNMEYTKEESETINEILDNLNLFVFIAEYVLFKDIEALSDINITFIYKKLTKIVDKYIKKHSISHLNEKTNELFHHLVLNNINVTNSLNIIELFMHKIKPTNLSNFNDNLMKTELHKNIIPSKYVNKLLA